ncbi:MAG TPA: methionyl-tRNA formyltransferase [Gemmataceae bacterium]|jgi:methionyl-tRNA formyltransferase|nr:methionyl-tRNA formyltransferase [Gemmataceae bacterium]
MMGTGAFAEPTFRALLAGTHPVVGLVTNPDRPSGRERDMVRGMKKIAQDHAVPVFQPESVNTLAGVAGLEAFQPELLVVAAYGQILSRDVLAVSRYGGINVHASLLPRYRGAAPIAWAIYHGETRTGVTIIKMSVHLDAGDMQAQAAVDIGPEETAGELEARLAPLGAKLALQVIDQVAAGTARGSPQDKSQATRAPKLTKEHGLIDWSRTAEQVRNQVRAMHPWPTAYTFLHRGQHPPLRLIVHKATPEAGPHRRNQQPGGIVLPEATGRHSGPDRLTVTAGDDTAVEILSLQPAGKRPMSAAEFLRGHPLQPGDRFGPEVS